MLQAQSLFFLLKKIRCRTCNKIIYAFNTKHLYMNLAFLKEKYSLGNILVKHKDEACITQIVLIAVVRCLSVVNNRGSLSRLLAH